MPSSSDHVCGALADMERLYDGLNRHGTDPRSVGWKNVSDQQLRFAKLAQLLPHRPDEPITVNDLGRGYGSLFAFLDELPGVGLRAITATTSASRCSSRRARRPTTAPS